MSVVRDRHLNEYHFAATIAVAMVIHVIVFAAWAALPQREVMVIPVRSLNIKLGDSEPVNIAPVDQPNLTPANTDMLEQSLARSFKDSRAELPPVREEASQEVEAPKVEETPAQPLPFKERGRRHDNEKLTDMEQYARKFVRPNEYNAQASGLGEGSVLGNSAESEAEALRKYEQLISRWINKFYSYPLQAQRQGMQGSGKVRIRIDRQGNIIFRVLEERTGHRLLDQAALEMVQRANPVPPVPEDYPGKGQRFEFLIPVHFYFEQ